MIGIICGLSNVNPLHSANGWVSGLFSRRKFGTQLGNKATPEKATARKRKPSTGGEIRLRVANATPLEQSNPFRTRPQDISCKPTCETCRVNATPRVRTSIVFLLLIKYLFIFIDSALSSNFESSPWQAILILGRDCDSVRWSINDRPCIICQVNSHKLQNNYIKVEKKEYILCISF